MCVCVCVCTNVYIFPCRHEYFNISASPRVCSPEHVIRLQKCSDTCQHKIKFVLILIKTDLRNFIL